MTEVFGVTGRVVCCKGRQCGHGAVHFHSWPSISQSIISLSPDQEQSSDPALQQAVVKYPPCHQPSQAVKQSVTSAIIILLVKTILSESVVQVQYCYF